MAISLKQLAARRKAAVTEKQQFQPLLDDVYEYVIPYRKGVSTTGKGEKRTNRVFDHTAMLSAFRSATRLAQDIAPSGQQFFDLKLGPLAAMVMDDAGKKQKQQQHEVIRTVTAAHFQTGEWDGALTRMCLDMEASTGTMLIVPDKDRQMSRFVSVPLEEVNITCNGYGEPNGYFWARKWTLQSIADDFGTKAFDDNLKKQLEEKPEAEFTLHQDAVYDVAAKRWERVAVLDITTNGAKNGLELERSGSRSCPWISGGFFQVPGEGYHRGPAMLVMPTVKALNVGKKLTLQAAAIALMGIYTQIDDGVFNPDNAAIAPGTFWKVARNGGTLGPSIQRLQDPRLDLSQLVFKDMGMDIQMGMNDQSLPPDGAAVRSATEILERVKRLAGDHMGASGPIIMRVIVPAVQRVMEIAFDFKQLPETVDIDRLLVDIHVSSPMALAREAERMQKLTQYVDLCLMLLQAKQQGMDRYAKTDLIAPDIGRAMGVPERYIPSDEERQQMDQQQAAAAAAATVAQSPEAMKALTEAA